VDARTVAALDAITAFADPNPNCSSQNQSVFSGLVARQVAPPNRSLSLLRSGKVLFRQSFQPSTPAKLNGRFIDVNAILSVKTKYLCTELWKTWTVRSFQQRADLPAVGLRFVWPLRPSLWGDLSFCFRNLLAGLCNQRYHNYALFVRRQQRQPVI